MLTTTNHILTKCKAILYRKPKLLLYWAFKMGVFILKLIILNWGLQILNCQLLLLKVLVTIKTLPITIHFVISKNCSWLKTLPKQDEDLKRCQQNKLHKWCHTLTTYFQSIIVRTKPAVVWHQYCLVMNCQKQTYISQYDLVWQKLERNDFEFSKLWGKT